MSIALVVTRGYGNGTLVGSITDVTRRGYNADSGFVPTAASAVGGHRRRRFVAETFHIFNKRYQKVLDKDDRAPDLPIPVVALDEVREVKPEVVATETFKAEAVASELDALLVSVKAEIEIQKQDLAKRQAKRAGTKRVEKKITQLAEKQDVLVEAKAYTDEYIQDRQEEEMLIILTAQILLQ